MAWRHRTCFVGIAATLFLLAGALPAAAAQTGGPGSKSITVSGSGSTWVGRPSSTTGGGRTVVTGRTVTSGARQIAVTQMGAGTPADGSTTQAAPPAPAAPAAPPASSPIVIKRQTLVVGGDGRLQAPAAPASPASSTPGWASGQTPPPATGGAPTRTAPTPPAAPSDPGSLTPEERQLVDLVNAARRAAGLPELRVDPHLVAAAREKAADLAASGAISHHSARLGWPWDQWRRLGIAYLTGGENVAATSSVARAHDLFLASPGHRANVLRPQYTHVGVGVAAMSPFGLVVVEHFTWEP